MPEVQNRNPANVVCTHALQASLQIVLEADTIPICFLRYCAFGLGSHNRRMLSSIEKGYGMSLQVGHIGTGFLIRPFNNSGMVSKTNKGKPSSWKPVWGPSAGFRFCCSLLQPPSVKRYCLGRLARRRQHWACGCRLTCSGLCRELVLSALQRLRQELPDPCVGPEGLRQRDHQAHPRQNKNCVSYDCRKHGRHSRILRERAGVLKGCHIDAPILSTISAPNLSWILWWQPNRVGVGYPDGPKP